MSESESEGENERSPTDKELSGVSRLAEGDSGGDSPSSWDDLDDGPDEPETPPEADETKEPDEPAPEPEVEPEDTASDAEDAEDDDLPPVRDWPQKNMNLHPALDDEYYDRWREFRNAYEDEHREEPERNAHFNNALVKAGLTGEPLDDILQEIIDEDPDYIS